MFSRRCARSWAKSLCYNRRFKGPGGSLRLRMMYRVASGKWRVASGQRGFLSLVTRHLSSRLRMKALAGGLLLLSLAGLPASCRRAKKEAAVDQPKDPVIAIINGRELHRSKFETFVRLKEIDLQDQPGSDPRERDFSRIPGRPNAPRSGGEGRGGSQRPGTRGALRPA